MSYTPGKWSVEDKTAFGDGWSINSDHEFELPGNKTHRIYVAQFCGNKEDAQLISVSKELLQSLKDVLLDIDFMIEAELIPDIRDAVVYSNAFAAIKKAEEHD